MRIDADHTLLKHFHQIRYSTKRPDEVLFVVTEQEIVAVLELNERLYAENEKLKAFKELGKFRSYLESLESRVSQLEDKQK